MSLENKMDSAEQEMFDCGHRFTGHGAFFSYVLEDGQNNPLGVALKVAIKRGGETKATAFIQEDGGIALWLKDSCLGTFDCLRDAYKKLSTH